MAMLQCPDCPKTFKTASGLAWHMEHIHGQGDGERLYSKSSAAMEVPQSGVRSQDPWPSIWELIEHCESGTCEEHLQELTDLVRFVDRHHHDSDAREAMLSGRLLQFLG